MTQHHFTRQLIDQLQQAYDRLNDELFDSQLPSCLLTLRGGNGRFGYFSPARFVSPQGEKIDEIALNAGFFALRSVEQVLSTLAHEMVHQWQQHYGAPGKHGHHNREWVDKMQAIGLQPSATGLPEGKTTGSNVSHYIVPDGAFCRLSQTMVKEGFALPWLDRHAPTEHAIATERYVQLQTLETQGLAFAGSPPPLVTAPAVLPAETTSEEQSPPTVEPFIYQPPPKRVELNPRVKFECPCCHLKAWARNDAELHCGHCDEMMHIAERG